MVSVLFFFLSGALPDLVCFRFLFWFNVSSRYDSNQKVGVQIHLNTFRDISPDLAPRVP